LQARKKNMRQCRRIETFATRLSDWRQRVEQPRCAGRQELKMRIKRRFDSAGNLDVI
jgi:hypothetical protein